MIAIYNTPTNEQASEIRKIAKTFVLKVDRLVDSDEEYIGIADYVVLEGDLSLLSACQLLSMEEWLAWEYVKRWNDYYGPY